MLLLKSELMVAIEFGYKGCEKGWNIQKTMEEAKRLTAEPEKDDWNLADASFHRGYGFIYEYDNIKKFIEKVKEDIENTKMTCPDCKAIDKPKCIEYIEIIGILDKRSGKI